MAGVDDYSKTAGSNTTVGGVSIAEGMSPASVNNAERADLADTAMWVEDLSGSNTTGGSANAQTLTTDSTWVALSETTMLLGFTAGFTNTGATTLNVDALGAQDVKKYTVAGLAALEAGDITAGGKYLVVYEATGADFILLNPSAVVSLTGTQTLTNKTLTAPAISQVVFPATQVASADANTLDDYEEGTFTPSITFATPGNLSVAYNTQTGSYVKVGKIVHCFVAIFTSSFTHTTASGNLTLTGLPFAVAGNNSAVAFGFGGMTKAGYDTLAIEPVGGGTTCLFAAAGSGVFADYAKAADMPSGGTVRIIVNFSYLV